MDKVRVYELARELGMTSPETIQLLKSKLKVRVKSASSTIEEDIAIKLKRLIRLEGTGALKARAKPKPVDEGAGDEKGRVRSAAKLRAEKARLALLKEMDEEERAAKRAKEEKQRREQEEAERRLAEEAAREAAAAVAAAEAARQDEEERAAAVLAAMQEEVAAAAAADAVAESESAASASESVNEAPSPSEPAPQDSEPTLPAVEAPETPAPSESPESVPAAPKAAKPSELDTPVAAARAGQTGQKVKTGKTPSAPTRPAAFVPGPTSQYIRTARPPSASRGAQVKPMPPPPRPAAPIKTVSRRRPDGKPKAKEKGPKRVSHAVVADVNEQALPDPKPRVEPPQPQLPTVFRKISLTEGVTVKELAEKMEAKHKDVIKALMGRGLLATINQTLDTEVAMEVAKQFGCEAEILSFEEDVLREETTEERPEDLQTRGPVVTVMGHVDHGKTSLLDAIRETKVVEKEAGGITQHVGAYSVGVNSRRVVFLDTPGHEAFTMMRARGARVTDIVILVVAADDGVMPQTREAIDHARAAGVPIMVAVNKIDKPGANPDRVKQQLADLDLAPEAWGGSTVLCEVSAKKREGLDLLLEMVLLVADLQELKANPNRAGMGTVLEAKLDKGKGPVAHVLVQNGSVQVGDSFIAGAVYGKVRAMLDDRGHKVKKVGPASPVEILGLTSLPQAGDQFQVFTDSFKARQIGEFRQQKLRERQLAGSARLTLDQLHQNIQEGTIKELPIVVKADVQGSAEVLTDTLTKLSSDKVKVRIIHAGVGAITENDVLLASASNAIIIGFNVRPQRTASDLADKENIDIRLHTVIYNVTDELKKAMEGLLEPTFKEVVLGRAEVRNTFKVPKVGTIGGCYVVEGKVTRSADVRLLRDNVVIHEGKIGSLRRFKDDASEVREGFECGIGLGNYNDIKIGDIIEAFTMEKVKSTAS